MFDAVFRVIVEPSLAKGHASTPTTAYFVMNQDHRWRGEF